MQPCCRAGPSSLLGGQTSRTFASEINVAPSSCSLGLGEAQGGALGEGRHTSFCALAAPPLPGLEPCSRASMNDMAAGFRHHSRPLAAGWPDSCYTAAPALAPRQNSAASADPPPAGCTIGAPGGALDLGRLKTAAWTTARSTASCSARVQLRISSGGVKMSLLHGLVRFHKSPPAPQSLEHVR